MTKWKGTREEGGASINIRHVVYNSTPQLIRQVSQAQPQKAGINKYIDELVPCYQTYLHLYTQIRITLNKPVHKTQGKFSVSITNMACQKITPQILEISFTSLQCKMQEDKFKTYHYKHYKIAYPQNKFHAPATFVKFNTPTPPQKNYKVPTIGTGKLLTTNRSSLPLTVTLTSSTPQSRLIYIGHAKQGLF